MYKGNPTDGLWCFFQIASEQFHRGPRTLDVFAELKSFTVTRKQNYKTPTSYRSLPLVRRVYNLINCIIISEDILFQY